MILIVGGTGVLGQRAARLLLAEGYAVRVMTREPARAAGLKQQGAEVVRGDLVHAPSLRAACRGVAAVFAAAHSIMGHGRYRSELVDGAGHRALVDAAKQAGASRLIYTSALGASPDHPIDFFRTKYALEQYVMQSGLQYVVLRPSAFMELHVHELNGRHVLDSGRAVLLGPPSRKRNFVAAGDVAHVAARALVDAHMVGRVVEIRGPEDFSDSEVAMIYASAAGFTPRIVHVPRWLTAVVGHVVHPLHPGIARIMRMASLEEVNAEGSPQAELLPEHCSVQRTRLQDFVQEQVVRARTGSVAM